MAHRIEPKAVFSLEEYTDACVEFFWGVTQGIMKASNAVYAKIEIVEVPEVYDQKIETPTGATTVLEGVQFNVSIELSLTKLTNGEPGYFAELAYNHAMEALDQYMPQFYQRIGKLSDDMGNTVDAKGKGPSWDLFIDTLEKRPLDFDAHGNITGLTIVSSPEVAEAFKRLGPMTEQQTARLNALIARKKEEFNARQRNRKLS